MSPGRAGTRGRRRQSGQSLVEFCVVVPTFLFLVLMILQAALIYRAKATLDYATFQAARAGATGRAQVSAMRDALAGGMTPLYTTSTGAAQVLEARARAQLDVTAFARIEVLSPTRAAWSRYRERQYDGRYALPNDSLAFRNAAIDGGSGVNVQDANILKVKVTYHYPLIVPFVDRVIVGLSDLVSEGESYRPVSMMVVDPISGHRRLPIVSTAVIRMQSPIYDSSPLPAR